MTTTHTPTIGDKIATWFGKHYNDMEGHWSEERLADYVDSLVDKLTRDNAALREIVQDLIDNPNCEKTINQAKELLS